MEGGGEENIREDKERGRETRHTGLVQSRLWRLGVGLVSMGPREQTDSGREKRKQRSILSELGSYPRGHRIGLAHGESQRRSGVGGGAIYIILFWTKEDILYVSTRERYLYVFACGSTEQAHLNL